MARVLKDEEAPWPEDGLEALQHEGVQQRVAFAEIAPLAKHRLVAVRQGFSLHADTWVHANAG